MARLARLFVAFDMMLAEINPLGELQDGSFVALDAHMEMENEARPRQKEILHELGVGDEETRLAREGRRSLSVDAQLWHAFFRALQAAQESIIDHGSFGARRLREMRTGAIPARLRRESSPTSTGRSNLVAKLVKQNRKRGATFFRDAPTEVQRIWLRPQRPAGRQPERDAGEQPGDAVYRGLGTIRQERERPVKDARTTLPGKLAPPAGPPAAAPFRTCAAAPFRTC